MKRTWLVAAGLLLSAGILCAQVNVEATMVTILATVTDNQGRYIADLKPEDFELREEGRLQQISTFTTARNVPASVGIVLDTSGSMRDKIGTATNAIEDFALGLKRDDEIFVMGFSDRPHLISEETDGRPELVSKLRRVETGGESALYDALQESIRKVKLGRYGRRILLVVTDGADSASGITYNQIMRIIRESDVLIYCLGIPGGITTFPAAPGSQFMGQIVIEGPRGAPQPLPIPLPGGRTMPIPIPGNPVPFPPSTPQPPDRGETVNMSVLDAIAEASGGLAWRIEDRQRRVGEPIDRILSRISAELGSQYIIGFVPSHPVNDNQWHDIEVRTRDIDYAVRARREYFGR